MIKNLKTNIPLPEIVQFREFGYIDLVLEELVKLKGFDDYEFYIYITFSVIKDPVLAPPSRRKQIIFLIGDESGDIPNHLREQVFEIFRHYSTEKEEKGNLFHLPVGYSRAFTLSNNVVFNERKYNVFFLGNLHNGRYGLYKYLIKMYFVPFFILHRFISLFKSKFDFYFPPSFICFARCFHTGLGPSDYSNKLSESKIVLCPHGIENVETMRVFEAMKAGAIIISESLPQVYCYKDSPIIIVKEWKELNEIIPKLLANPDKMEDLLRKTISWWNSHASEKITAVYICNIIRKLEKLHS